MMTITDYIKARTDAELLKVFEEVNDKVVPATSEAHTFVRDINNLIDKGQLCINDNMHRRVYLPTVSKYIYKELACRFLAATKDGRLDYEGCDY